MVRYAACGYCSQAIDDINKAWGKRSLNAYVCLAPPRYTCYSRPMGNIEIVYQDDEILAVNKPCGISTQGGRGAGVPLDEILAKQTGEKVYLVHRLDRETAGIMIVGRTAWAATKWTKRVANGEVQKEYEAICIGVPKNKEGVITLPIKSRTRSGAVEEKDAATKYCVIKTWTLSNSSPILTQNSKDAASFSLVSCRLLTGRTHQIRLHLSGIGCPIAMDDKHGNFAMNKWMRRIFGTKHLCLASVCITFNAKDGEKSIRIEMPNHMKMLTQSLESDTIGA